MSSSNTNVNREELKKAIVELLRSDWEFRRVVAAELGLLEILERLEGVGRRLEEHTRVIRELLESMVKLEERVARLEERVTKLEERFAKLEERFLKLEERVAKLEEAILEHTKALRLLEERVTKLEERVARLEERLLRVEERLEEHSRAIRALQEQIIAQGEAIRKLSEAVSELTARITAIGFRYGVFTEDAFREAVKFLVEDLLREYRVEKWEYYDSEGIVYGHPAVVEVDVLIRDGTHILVEYKASADKSDVAELYRLGKLYEKVTGVKPKLLLVAPAVRKRAAELAKKLGVEIRGSIADV